MPPLNRAQRVVLAAMLVIDLLLCLFPPGRGGGRALGHNWFLVAWTAWGEPVTVSLGELALELLIVTLVGATAVALLTGKFGAAAWLRKFGVRWLLIPAGILVGVTILAAALVATITALPTTTIRAPSPLQPLQQDWVASHPGASRDEIYRAMRTPYPYLMMQDWVASHPGASRDEIYRATRAIFAIQLWLQQHPDATPEQRAKQWRVENGPGAPP